MQIHVYLHLEMLELRINISNKRVKLGSVFLQGNQCCIVEAGWFLVSS